MQRYRIESAATSQWCQFFPNIGQVFTAPKRFAIDDEAGQAKHASRFFGITDCIVFDPTRTR